MWKQCDMQKCLVHLFIHDCQGFIQVGFPGGGKKFVSASCMSLTIQIFKFSGGEN